LRLNLCATFLDPALFKNFSPNLIFLIVYSIDYIFIYPQIAQMAQKNFKNLRHLRNLRINENVQTACR